MATRTPNLNLQLPGKGEFRDSWNVPVNDNFSKIDTWSGDVQTEITDARFNAASLKEFLAVAHAADGTLYPTQEVFDARNSYLYGNKTGTNYYLLKNLSLLRDKEIWAARAGQDSLKSGMAFAKSFGLNQILSGAKDANGYPIFAGSTITSVTINGSTVPIWLEIGGKICRIRTLEQVDLSTAPGPGTYFIYAEYSENGKVRYTGTTGSCGQEVATSDIKIHADTSINYNTVDVKAGDVLNYSLPTTVEGDYIIATVAPVSEAPDEQTKLQIIGVFPQETSAVTYTIRDPLAVTLGFSPTEDAVAGRIYLAECDWDGAAVTAVRQRNFGTTFVGEWQHVPNVLVTPSFTKTWLHALGTDKLQVTIQVSQANDGSQPIEELTLAQFSAALTGTIGGSLSGSITATASGSIPVTAGGTFSNAVTGAPGLGTIANTGGSPVIVGAPSAGTLGVTINDAGKTYSGDGTAVNVAVTDGKTFAPDNGTLDVSLSPLNSVKMQYTKNSISIKNAQEGSFYTDFFGATKVEGYVRVIISKKG